MSASPTASAPSRSRNAAGRARGLHAAVLMYPDANGDYPHAQSAYTRACGQQARSLERALPRTWRVYAGVGASCDDVLHSAAATRPQRLVVVWMNPFVDAQERASEIQARYGEVVESGLAFRHNWWNESSLIDLHVRHVREVAEQRGLSPADTLLVLRTRQCRDHASGGAVGQMAALIGGRLGWPLSRIHVQGPGGGSPPGSEESILVHDLDMAHHVMPCEAGGADGCKRPSLPVLEHPARIASPSLSRARLISTLSSLVRRGRYPMSPSSPPLFSWSGVQCSVQSTPEVVMVGACVKGALGAGGGPLLRFCDSETFRCAKRPHNEVMDVLAQLRGGVFREILVWNTCNRLELYGWPCSGAGAEAVRQEVDRARRLLLRCAADDANVLHGASAHQHVLRTAVGLNSVLIGDADVLDQLESAHRTAEHAGTAGVHVQALLNGVVSVVQYVRERTAWGCFAHQYCETALDQLRRRLSLAPRARCVVIGGSTTGASVLEALRASFGLGCEELTLVYRGQRSGALMKRLHMAIGGGTVVNVESYSDPAVVETAARADAVFLAGDHRQPVLTGKELAAARGTGPGRLVVVDFNTLGSTDGLHQAPGVDVVTAGEIEAIIGSFNQDVAALPTFGPALAGVEALIAQHARIVAAGASSSSGVHSGEEVAA